MAGSVLNPGSVLKSRYKIEKVIYEGSRVNIYYGIDMHMPGKFWAVREMQIGAGSPAERASLTNKFLKEAASLSLISHPAAAKVIDFFSEGEYIYIVREFIPGTDLSSLMETRGEPFSEEQAVNWGLQLADFFHYLSQKKFPPVFYKEFNMGNLLVNQKSELKLTDFGLARIFYGDTGLGNIAHLGACEYAAPEQYAEHPSFDMRSLVYILGAFLYHAVTNVIPSPDPREFRSVKFYNPSISPALGGIIKKAIDPSPSRRYQSLNEMKRHLASCLQANKGKSRGEYSLDGGNAGNAIFVTLAAVLLCLIGFIAYYFFLR
ncbi:MAG: serine/threonine protein kinase [bacterium]|nr:serine/threonine protein kinase [bacterium]